MIATIEGLLLQAGRETIIGVAGGAVGLDVHLSERSMARLPAVGETVRLWTHLVVREDAWTLYGFIDREERTMFRLLTTVSGIGPRVAVGMLSAAEPSEIARCLRAGDEARLARLPGIGKKSAARLVVELGQRVPAAMGEASAGGAPDAADPVGEVMAAGLGAVAHEALRVLVALGLPAPRAEMLLQQIGRDQPETTGDAAAWVRAALERLETPGR